MKKLFQNIWILRSLLYSIFFNFYYLPFRQAIYLPILLYKPKFKSLKGTIRIQSDSVNFGMIQMGRPIVPIYPNTGIMWENKGGQVILKGKTVIGNNSYISIGEKGNLDIASDFIASSSLKLVCFYSITIKENVRFGWDILMMDTDFHRLKNMDGAFIGTAVKPIVLGNNIWIGTKTVILKGAMIPPYCIVGACSLVNKKYEVPSHSLLSGIPAVLKKTGLWRDINDRLTNDIYAMN